MKILMVALALGLGTGSAFGQATTTADSTSLLDTLKKSPFSAAADLTIETVKDDGVGGTYDLDGTDSWLDLNTSYSLPSLNSKVNLRQEFEFNTRASAVTAADSSASGFESSYLTSEIHFSTKWLQARTEGLDLLTNFRYVYLADNETRVLYQNNGNLQARVYWGLPIAGKFIIDRYTTYIRVKKYLTKNTDDNINSPFSRARDYELRARVSPAYVISDSVKAAIRFEYNQVHQLNNRHGNSLSLMPNVRITSGDWAFSPAVEFEYLGTTNSSQLAALDQFEDEVVYSLNIERSLF